MNLINETWRGLVRRKLWPVALLLVAALVAVPVTLAKEPEVVPAPPTRARRRRGLPATYVTAATETDRPRARRPSVVARSARPRTRSSRPRCRRPRRRRRRRPPRRRARRPPRRRPRRTGRPLGWRGGGTTAPIEPVATATPTATPKPAPANSSACASRAKTEGTDERRPSRSRARGAPERREPGARVPAGSRTNGKVAVFELTGTVTAKATASAIPRRRTAST